MRISLLLVLGILILVGSIFPAAAQTTSTRAKRATFERETGDSPRKSELKSTTATAEIIRRDIDNDGDPDTLERWWNVSRVRWIDENDDMTKHDMNGDRNGDTLQIDRNGDGYYDGPGDMNVSWKSKPGSVKADYELVAIHPWEGKRPPDVPTHHWMIFEDVDGDGVFGCIDWDTFSFDCWGIDEVHPNFKPDYNGDSVFLKEHLSPLSIRNPEYNWENPFVFIDHDGDGLTEVSVRYTDRRTRVDPTSFSLANAYYDGNVEDAYLSWDIDNDTGRDNELDYDFTIKFSGGTGVDYHDAIHHVPDLRSPEWTRQFFRVNNWREIDRLVYTSHKDAYNKVWESKWEEAIFIWDEDDDDHRWERVELYLPKDNAGNTNTVYGMERWKFSDRKTSTTKGINSYVQADSLGDRGEYDSDFSGGGELYIGSWDGKLHLRGAEWGAWLVDRDADYWGAAGPARGNASDVIATRTQEVVQYQDQDNDGFFDLITYDYDGNEIVDFQYDFLQDGPIVAHELFPLTTRSYQELVEAYQKLANDQWDEALKIYRAAWKKGLNDSELDDLAIAAATMEKHEHAYWLKETVIRRLRLRAAHNQILTSRINTLYFSGDTEGLVEVINNQSWKEETQ